MSVSGLRIAVIILELSGIFLLVGLLITPARRHAIVTSLVVAAVLRSFVAVLPPLVYLRHPAVLDLLNQNPMAQRLCTGDAILVRYLTVVKAAFSVSFVLPLIFLSYRYAKEPGASINGRTLFRKWTTIMLAVGPFLWALPTIFTPIPAIVRDINSVGPLFDQAICTIGEPVFQVVALLLMIIPLALATIFSIIFVFMLWGNDQLPLSTHDFGLLDIIRLLRFGALLFIFIISVSLYSIIMSKWVKSQDNPQDNSFAINTLLSISIVWEAITPILLFLIFAAHENVFTLWRSWIERITDQVSTALFAQPREPRPTSYIDFEEPNDHRWYSAILAPARRFILHKQPVEQANRHSLSNHSLPKVAPWPYVDPMARPPSLASRILQRPLSVQQSANISHGKRGPGFVSGLHPPPRPPRSRSESPVEGSGMGQTSLVNMPSLTAFGSGNSTASVPGVGQTDSIVEVKRSALYLQNTEDTGSRPSTADTFGNFKPDSDDRQSIHSDEI